MISIKAVLELILAHTSAGSEIRKGTSASNSRRKTLPCKSPFSPNPTRAISAVKAATRRTLAEAVVACTPDSVTSRGWRVRMRSG